MLTTMSCYESLYCDIQGELDRTVFGEPIDEDDSFQYIDCALTLLYRYNGMPHADYVALNKILNNLDDSLATAYCKALEYLDNKIKNN